MPNKSTKFTSDYELVLDLSGIRWLSYRDVPLLIKKYATTGNLALDYGCGSGTSTMLIKLQGFNAEGVDVSADMIECAKKYDPTGRYTVIESGNIPAEENTYDLILLGLVLQFIGTKEGIKTVMREVYRCLKKGGIAMVTVPSKNAFTYNTSYSNRDFVENHVFYNGSITKIEFKQTGSIMIGYNWDDSVYYELMADVGLKLICTHRPLGDESDKYSWTVENKQSFYTIFVARKEA